MSEIRIAKSWDSFNPVVHDGGEAISTRWLENRYRLMEDAMKHFIMRVENGEVRSKRTYEEFKNILEGGL